MAEFCFCEPGTMSRCVAKDYKEEMSCKFFTKSGCGNRCMNRNKQLKNHCWDARAQAAGLHLPEPDAEQEIELDLSDLLDAPERKKCTSCTRYVCAFLQNQNDENVRITGRALNGDELWNIGTHCRSYDDNAQGGA